MLRRLDLRGVPDPARDLPRPTSDDEGPVAAVREILATVRGRGDDALRAYSEKFDGVVLEELSVSRAEQQEALAAAVPLLREALEAAVANIAAYQRSAVATEALYERDGLVVRELRRPVNRAGLYVPGGRACYPSTVLMTAIPARVAGVPELVMCVPPGADGRVPGPTLAAAALVQIDEVYRIGGAQAIGAMAFGTETIRPVDIIVGPGNLYVALAKREVAGTVGVPSAFAGPSEVVVIADDTTPAPYAAIDVVVQAEHGPHGLAWLITWSESTADAVLEEIARVVRESPRRVEVESTLAAGGCCVLVDGPEQALAVSNAIAPEHLQIMSADPDALLPLVQNAGAVFCGPFAPAAVGDYFAGPSHVLPTHGSARFAGALRADDFVRHIHVISMDEGGLARVAPHVMAMADAEGLAAHRDAVRIRGSR